MMYLLNIDFADIKVTIVNTVIIFFVLIGIYSGYKKGFLESSVRFLGTLVAIVGAYLFKNPISVYLYTHLPFFKIGGIFKGVTVLNILIYELIAFILLFSLLMICIKIACKLTGLIDRVLSWIFLFGLPNKVLGAVVGFLESVIILFFVCFGFKFVCNFMNVEYKESLADYVVEIPVLNNIFGDTLNVFDEISLIAKDYDSINSKDEYNYMALDILLKYEVISIDNTKVLIENKKINIPNVQDLLEKYGD